MKKTIFTILIISGLVLPLFTRAQLIGPIVPCGRCCEEFSADGTQCVRACEGVSLEEAHPCTLCHIFLMIQRIINFILVAIFVIAPIFIIAGGIIILISVGNPEKTGLGKRIIFNTIIGIVIALVSWTVLNVLFNTLVSVGPDGIPWPWNEVRCVGGGIIPPEEGGAVDRCSRMSTPGYCFGNNYYCQAGIRDQVSDATPELVSLLNCMAERLPSGDARNISSISDNSGGRCFSNWNSQCPTGTDSCGGTCCGHIQNSLHYGGYGCRGFSYAVDFAMESACDIIRSAANWCGANLGLGDVDTICEPDHVHVELDGLAKQRSCI